MNDSGRLQRIEAAFRGIFDRQYYANNGPLVQQFDRDFADHLSVDHAVAVVNPSAALMIAARCLLPDGGEVIVSALASPAVTGGLVWAGLVPRFADVDPETLALDATTVAPRITARTVGILADHPASGAEELETLADRAGLRLIFEATGVLGGARLPARPGCRGDATVFAFHRGSILDAAGSAAVTTRDRATADMLRTARNFHGSETFAEVPLRMNAKMSEAQAAMALVGLADLPRALAACGERRGRYVAALRDVPGVRLGRDVDDVRRATPAPLTVRFDSDFDDSPDARVGPGLRLTLNPAVADHDDLPAARSLCPNTLRLPCSPSVATERIDAICTQVRRLAEAAWVPA